MKCSVADGTGFRAKARKTNADESVDSSDISDAAPGSKDPAAGRMTLSTGCCPVFDVPIAGDAEAFTHTALLNPSYLPTLPDRLLVTQAMPLCLVHPRVVGRGIGSLHSGTRQERGGVSPQPTGRRPGQNSTPSAQSTSRRRAQTARGQRRPRQKPASTGTDEADPSSLATDGPLADYCRCRLLPTPPRFG